MKLKKSISKLITYFFITSCFIISLINHSYSQKKEKSTKKEIELIRVLSTHKTQGRAAVEAIKEKYSKNDPVYGRAQQLYNDARVEFNAFIDGFIIRTIKGEFSGWEKELNKAIKKK